MAADGATSFMSITDLNSVEFAVARLAVNKARAADNRHPQMNWGALLSGQPASKPTRKTPARTTAKKVAKKTIKKIE